MDNPKKLATRGTHKTKKNKTKNTILAFISPSWCFGLDRFHCITEILLKVALNTIPITPLKLAFGSVLLVEEILRKPLTCRKSQTLSHNVVSSTPHHERDWNSQLYL
jgi:hypothetical protein